jgi:hypothetical protein
MVKPMHIQREAVHPPPLRSSRVNSGCQNRMMSTNLSWSVDSLLVEWMKLVSATIPLPFSQYCVSSPTFV